MSTSSARRPEAAVAISVRVPSPRPAPPTRPARPVLPGLPDDSRSPEPLPSPHWPSPRTAVALLTALGRAHERRNSDGSRPDRDRSGQGVSDYRDCDALVRVQDAMFWFYRPLAHQIAADNHGAAGDRKELAEAGLAKAILGWTRPDAWLFEEYARQAIRAELCSGIPVDVHHNPLLARVRARPGSNSGRHSAPVRWLN